MLTLVDSSFKEEPNRCFKVSYISGEIELIAASSMGSTEDLKDFVTFYEENNTNLDLVCMINQSIIKKIESIVVPSVSENIILKSELQSDLELYND